MSYSKTIMKGRMTKNIELKVISENSLVGNFSIAVDRNYKFKGEEYPRTDFFECRCWNKLAETIAKYFHKGSNILVSGHFENDNYDKDGKTVYRNVLIVDEFDFVDVKEKEQEPEPTSIEE